MYLRGEITTSCRKGDTKYTRLNLLGWAMLCPHAKELILHGSTPPSPTSYSTAQESKRLHDSLKRVVSKLLPEAVRNVNGVRVDFDQSEYDHELGINVGDEALCASSKADLVYTLSVGGSLVTLYVEVSTRLHVAKPWQALLRGIALYYERGMPTWVILVSPEKLMYKQLEDRDQVAVISRMRASPEGFEPSANLCSLCELLHYCPYRVV